MIMIETRAWGSVPTQLDDLRAKFKAYFSFVVDGGLVKKYPDSLDRPIRIQLDCFEVPPPEIRRFLRRLGEIAEEYGIRTVLQVLSTDGTAGILEPI